MEVKLGDSEIKVMDVLWKEGDVPAKYVADLLNERYGWNIKTTYTLLKRCIKKGVVERREPNFICHALVSKSCVQQQETAKLIKRVFDGSVDKLFVSLLGQTKLSQEQIEALKKMVEDKSGGD